MRVYYPKLYTVVHLDPLNVLLLPRDITIIFYCLVLQLVLCRVVVLKVSPYIIHNADKILFNPLISLYLEYLEYLDR